MSVIPWKEIRTDGIQKRMSQKNRKYPESEKLLEVSEKSQAIGEFLEWLESNEIILGIYVGDCMHPFHYTMNALLAEYFEVDMNKVEEERRQMLKEMSS